MERNAIQTITKRRVGQPLVFQRPVLPVPPAGKRLGIHNLPAVNVCGRGRLFHHPELRAVPELAARYIHDSAGAQRFGARLTTMSIRAAMDVEDGHPGLGQRRETVNRVVLRSLFAELFRAQTVGAAGPVEAGPTAEVADRINAGNAPHRLGMLSRPVIKHQAAATPGQQAGLAAEPAPFNQLPVQGVEVGASLRIAIGFADVHAGHGNAGRQKTFEHPTFASLGEAGQRGGVPNPRSGTIRVEVLSRRKNYECGATIDFRDFSRQRQVFLRLRCVGSPNAVQRESHRQSQ